MSRFYNIDIALSFNIDSEILEYNDELQNDILYEFVDEFVSDLNEVTGIEYVDNYDYDWNNKDHSNVCLLFVESKYDSEETKRIVNTVLNNKSTFTYTTEIFDGTYYDERHGFDYGPAERVYNSDEADVVSDVDFEILKFEEVDEDGNPLTESVSKNELRDRAKRHSKKQKGLPALSTLTNAGNVEHNINMFNHMMNTNGGPSNNPISGPMGGDVSSTACCESLDETTPRYIARKFNWAPDECSITCYDTEDDEEFDKWICNGMWDEDNGRMNAKRFIENPDFDIPKHIRNELISTFGLDDFNHKIEESISDDSLNDNFDMFLRSYL